MALTPTEQARHAAELARAKRMRAQEHADSQKMRTGGRPKSIIGTDNHAGPHGQWHDKEIRSILSDAGYRVARSGGYTARAHSAWEHYLEAKRSGHDPRAAAHAWNSTPLGQQYKGSQPVGPGPGTRRGGAYVGPGGDNSPGFRDFVKQHPGYHPGHAPSGTVHGGGAGGGGGGPKGGGPKGGGNNVDLSGLQNIATKLGVILPRSFADKLADLQFGPAIHQAQLGLDNQHAQDAQSLADIANWYGQVQGEQKTAAGRDAAIGSGSVDHLKNAVASIVQSLGGGANGGAAEVGAAGADKVGLLSALAQNQDEYNSDIAPLLAQESAGAKSRQAAINSQADQKAQSALTDLLGQRGNAVASNLMQIIQANNATKQQGFQNKLALEQANEAALMAGLNVIQANQKIKANAQALKAGKKPTTGWAALDPTARENYVSHAVQQAMGQHTLNGVTDWKAVANTAREYLRGYNFGSARAPGYKGRVPNRVAQGQINSLLGNVIAGAQAKAKAAHP